MSPDNFMHEEVTFQDPTTLPPHAVTLVQLAVEVPALPLPLPPGRPPVLLAPPWELPALLLAEPAVPSGSLVTLQPAPTASAPTTNTPKNPSSPFRIGDLPKLLRF